MRPTLWTWKRILRRSRGDTTVRETAPATPPATKEARTGCARTSLKRWRAVSSGLARDCRNESIQMLQADGGRVRTLPSFPDSEPMMAMVWGCGCCEVFDMVQLCGARSAEKWDAAAWVRAEQAHVYRRREKVASGDVEIIGSSFCETVDRWLLVEQGRARSLGWRPDLPCNADVGIRRRGGSRRTVVAQWFQCWSSLKMDPGGRSDFSAGIGGEPINLRLQASSHPGSLCVYLI